MPVIQVEMELPSDELLKAVEKLSLPELEQFVQQMMHLLARRRAPVLPQKEAELLLKINQSTLPHDTQARCDVLVAKRQAEALTPSEYDELLHLSEQLEALNIQRLEYLTKLAQLRQTSLSELMTDLGLPEPLANLIVSKP